MGDEDVWGCGVDPTVPLSAAELSRAARVPRPRGRLAVAGRALQKHLPKNRTGSPYPALTGNAARFNRVAHEIVDEILSNPEPRVCVYQDRYIHAWPPPPDRRLLRRNLGGTFETLLQKP